MTTEQHIERLEKEVVEIKRNLDKLISLVEEMNSGLYGDEKNNHIGVIKRQSLLEEEVKNLKNQIEQIKAKNIEQDIAINARNNYKTEIMNWLRYITVGIIQIIVIWAIIKGTVSPDALLKF